MSILRVLPFLPLLVSAAPLAPQHRSMPAGGAPNATTSSDMMTLMLANYLENLEYDLYMGGCTNFTDTDYDTAGFPAGYRTDVVCKSAEQEKMHIDIISMALEAAGGSPVPSCSYNFPYNDTVQFVNLANMVTSVGIGAYMGGALDLTDNPALLTAAASILPIEARHSAALRYAQPAMLSPFPTAFETPLTAAWAYNLAQEFIVSCPMQLPLPILPTLTMAMPSALPPHPPANMTPTTVNFVWNATQVPMTNTTGDMYFAWINQATNVSFVPVQSCGEGCGSSIVPEGVEGVAFVVLTDMTNSTELTLQTLTNMTLAGPAEVVLS